jgi:hypothetical protein
MDAGTVAVARQAVRATMRVIVCILTTSRRVLGRPNREEERGIRHPSLRRSAQQRRRQKFSSCQEDQVQTGPVAAGQGRAEQSPPRAKLPERCPCVCCQCRVHPHIYIVEQTLLSNRASSSVTRQIVRCWCVTAHASASPSPPLPPNRAEIIGSERLFKSILIPSYPSYHAHDAHPITSHHLPEYDIRSSRRGAAGFSLPGWCCTRVASVRSRC